ncbi:hypothetical protein [Cyclobacterium plantarum]|uniref:Uncharacterized protein n=1 Tax=Cyclobacterium plantarum TaxID=2716263 RepID=A0ABX0H535_9BACT|nr:hypothetical protein [Cyclobacterium plantarum]NHE55958.1 hypothetical protein [Cyclobacterium plantarum]
MKGTLSLTIILSILCFIAEGQVSLSYKTTAKETVNLKNGDYYDSEVKPKSFVIKGIPLPYKTVGMVDVFRVMKNSGKEEEHYFKTVFYTDSSKPLVLDLEDMLSTNGLRFMDTAGFKVKVCVVNKADYLKLESRSQCRISEEVLIKYGH